MAKKGKAPAGKSVEAHRLMDEVFGPDAFISQFAFRKTAGQTSLGLAGTLDHILHYARDIDRLKFRQLFAQSSLRLVMPVMAVSQQWTLTQTFARHILLIHGAP